MTLIDVLYSIEIGIIIFSITLFILSLLAFRRSGYSRILFASAAFILFAIQFLLEYQDDTLDVLPDVEADILLSGITLIILTLFFLSLVYKKRSNTTG